ncbi:MAG: DUF4055 domain-containing protein [Eubacteriales bacterium]|nr:DUF4055 domain-containing protein [Eubacteriales bacterium]
MATVNKTHPDYDSMADTWKSCRDCVVGQRAVHAAGTRYLPQLTDQTDADYKAYVTRTLFYNATWRTISSLSGMLFRKEPVIEVSDSIKPMLEDVTMSGKSFYVLAKESSVEVLTSGRMGILVDYPQESVEGKTVAEVQAMGMRPSMQLYPAESIINWKTSRIGNSTVLSMLVLTESVALEGDSEFEHNSEIRYRVLDLAPRATLDGGLGGTISMAYRVRVFRVNNKDEDEQIGPEIFPVMNNKPLNFIPFFFLGVDSTTPELDEPPLIDLVDANLAHYRLDADHKHGLHFTGLPTPVVSGYTKENDNEKLYVGSSSAWVFPNPEARASYLEYTGQGLAAIASEKEKLEQYMAVLGARLLASEKKDTETAQTAQIHRAGESSILSSIAITINKGLTQALQVFSAWAGVEDKEAKVELNQEFLPPGITPQELTALLQGWQMGAPGLSDQGLFDILQKREVVAPDVTLEDEQERISSKPIPKPGVNE